MGRSPQYSNHLCQYQRNTYLFAVWDENVSVVLAKCWKNDCLWQPSTQLPRTDRSVVMSSHLTSDHCPLHSTPLHCCGGCHRSSHTRYTGCCPAMPWLPIPCAQPTRFASSAVECPLSWRAGLSRSARIGLPSSVDSVPIVSSRLTHPEAWLARGSRVSWTEVGSDRCLTRLPLLALTEGASAEVRVVVLVLLAAPMRL